MNVVKTMTEFRKAASNAISSGWDVNELCDILMEIADDFDEREDDLDDGEDEEEDEDDLEDEEDVVQKS